MVRLWHMPFLARPRKNDSRPQAMHPAIAHQPLARVGYLHAGAPWAGRRQTSMHCKAPARDAWKVNEPARKCPPWAQMAMDACADLCTHRALPLAAGRRQVAALVLTCCQSQPMWSLLGCCGTAQGVENQGFGGGDRASLLQDPHHSSGSGRKAEGRQCGQKAAQGGSKRKADRLHGQHSGCIGSCRLCAAAKHPRSCP